MHFQNTLKNRKLKKQHLFESEIFCNIKNVFTDTFDQFNVFSLLIFLLINFFPNKNEKLTDPKLLKGSARKHTI